MNEREALEAIAGFGSVNLAGEYEHGLRDIIRSMTDCAKDALRDNLPVRSLMDKPFPDFELMRLTNLVLAVRKPRVDSMERAEYAMAITPDVVHRLLVEIDRLKGGTVAIVPIEPV
jgi:hypothetical protein